MEALQTMQEPQNGVDLAQSVAAYLDAKRDTQLLEVCVPSSSSTSERVRG
jgi:hypothetical protein